MSSKCLLAILRGDCQQPAEVIGRAASCSLRNCKVSVVIGSGGMRIELTGAHADRVVRQLLGRLGGFAC
jgi:hypothetical protein